MQFIMQFIMQFFSQISNASEYLDLLNTGSLKPQVVAVVGKRADLLMIAVIAHADDGNL